MSEAVGSFGGSGPGVIVTSRVYIYIYIYYIALKQKITAQANACAGSLPVRCLCGEACAEPGLWKMPAVPACACLCGACAALYGDAITWRICLCGACAVPVRPALCGSLCEFSVHSLLPALVHRRLCGALCGSLCGACAAGPLRQPVRPCRQPHTNTYSFRSAWHSRPRVGLEEIPLGCLCGACAAACAASLCGACAVSCAVSRWICLCGAFLRTKLPVRPCASPVRQPVRSPCLPVRCLCGPVRPCAVPVRCLCRICFRYHIVYIYIYIYIYTHIYTIHCNF